MMTELTKDQAEKLAELVHLLRDDWDTRGVLSKLAEARARGTAFDVVHAALYAAQDPANRTPAVIPLAGAHWTRGKALGEAGPTDMPGRTRCTKPGHEHERAHNCRICISDAKALDDREAAARAALTRQGVPPERIRAILTGTPTPPSPQDRAAGEDR